MLLVVGLVGLTGCVVGDNDSARERTVPQSGPVILKDDFSDPETDWSVGTTPGTVGGYHQGRYRVRVTRNDEGVSHWVEIGSVVEAMRFEIDATQRTGSPRDEIGVICYAHVGANDDAGYQLSFSPDGWAQISRVLEGDSSVLEERTGEDAIRGREGMYRIRADCIGATRDEPAQLSLFVDGQLVAHATDNLGYFPRFDGIGVTTWSEDGETEAVYDNAVVRELR
jgi:hypothetical protein